MKKPYRRVAIAGVGVTVHGRYFPYKTWQEVLADAVFEALANSKNMSPKALEVGTVHYQGEAMIEAGGIGTIIADYLGMAPAPVIAGSANCTGSQVGLYMGWHLVASGRYDRVLVSGFEKGGDVIQAFELIPVSSDPEYDYMLGCVHVYDFAMTDACYLKKYGYPSIEPIAQWAVQCDWYAKRHPKALHYQTPPLTMAEAMETTAEGYRRRFLAQGEGASAVILVPADEAKHYTDKPIYIDGISYKCTSTYYGNRFYYKGFNYPGLDKFDAAESAVTIPAREEAFGMAGIKPDDVDLVEVYDLFGSGIQQMEALGIFPFGEGGRAVLDGETAIQGRCPANTDGGRIRFGHASGADGTDMVAEAVIQLRGEAGERQVADAKVAVCQSTAGINAGATVVVLSNKK